MCLKYPKDFWAMPIIFSLKDFGWIGSSVNSNLHSNLSWAQYPLSALSTTWGKIWSLRHWGRNNIAEIEANTVDLGDAARIQSELDEYYIQYPLLDQHFRFLVLASKTRDHSLCNIFRIWGRRGEKLRAPDSKDPDKKVSRRVVQTSAIWRS